LQLGINLTVVGPGEPMAIYHRENNQEDFLLLAGEALLIIEGEERRLRKWDFVHCPAGTSHVIIGAGEAGCLILPAERLRIGRHSGRFIASQANKWFLWQQLVAPSRGLPRARHLALVLDARL
jgi:hypothetical protein